MPRQAGRRRAALGTFGAAALLVAAACNGDGEAAEDTTTTERSTTSTTELEDPFAVPDEIVEPYVQRVLDELYSIQGDALRLTVERGVVDEDVLALLRSAFSEDWIRFLANSLAQAALDDFTNVVRPPGDTVVTVKALAHAERGCIFARTTQDGSEVNVDPPPAAAVFVELRPGSGNDTGWVIQSAPAVADDGAMPEDPCE